MGRSWMGIAAVSAWALVGCGGGDGGYVGEYGGGGGAMLDSYLGTTGVMLGWADDVSGTFSAAPIGSYAGKRQALRGSIDYLTGQSLGQRAGVEIYKGADGHIYALDLTSTQAPAAQTVSSESAATVDDTCSLSGTQVAGASYDYAGVYFAADLVSPTNSSYIYRLPGPDGVCNTADDVFHMVKTGMSPNDAPIVATGMPVATVKTATGGISGFVVKSGASLVLVDGNFANPVTLGTFAQPIGVAVAAPVGTVQGYPTGQLYVVDGNVVYVDYVGHTVSAPLFTIPNWTPTDAGAIFAASPTTLYVAVNTAASGSSPASATIYALPSNGSAPATAIDSEPGRIATLAFPVLGNNLIWGIENPSYTIRTVSASGGTPTTISSSTGNAGTFIATATTVYYSTWLQTDTSASNTVTRTQTASGIVGLDGTVVQAPLADSVFANGGELLPWPDDTTTTATAYETVFQIQNLSPVTVVDSTSGRTYTEDGVSGGLLVAIDVATNAAGAAIGQLPVSSAMFLGGTFRDDEHSGFLQASNALSTQDPATQDLYVLNSQQDDSLSRMTSNL